MSTLESARPYLVLRERDLYFALPCEAIREIVRLPTTNTVPLVPHDVRGVVNLRGDAIPLVDLRLRLGLQSAQEELREIDAMLAAREQDHVAWVEALCESVKEGTPFTKARDPHSCAFGKWYDSYEPASRAIAVVLKRFELPHAQMHATADVALNAAAAGDVDGAKASIQHARNILLPKMQRVFAEARAAFREEQRELAVILDTAGDARRIGLTVDGVESVERVPAEAIEPMPPSALGTVPFVRQVAHVGQQGRLVYLLDPAVVRAA